MVINNFLELKKSIEEGKYFDYSDNFIFNFEDKIIKIRLSAASNYRPSIFYGEWEEFFEKLNIVDVYGYISKFYELDDIMTRIFPLSRKPIHTLVDGIAPEFLNLMLSFYKILEAENVPSNSIPIATVSTENNKISLLINVI